MELEHATDRAKAALAAFTAEMPGAIGGLLMDAPRCPVCGYSAEDQRIHKDHRLCKGEIPTASGSPRHPGSPQADGGATEEPAGCSYQTDEETYDAQANRIAELEGELSDIRSLYRIAMAALAKLEVK